MIKRKNALDLVCFFSIKRPKDKGPGVYVLVFLLEVFVCTIHILLFQWLFVVCVESIILGYFIIFGKKNIQTFMKVNKN